MPDRADDPPAAPSPSPDGHRSPTAPHSVSLPPDAAARPDGHQDQHPDPADRSSHVPPRAVTITLPHPRIVLTRIGAWLAPPPTARQHHNDAAAPRPAQAGIGPWLARQLSLPRLAGLVLTVSIIAALAVTALDGHGSAPAGQVLQPGMTGPPTTTTNPGPTAGAPLALAVTAPPPTAAPPTTAPVTTLQPPAPVPAAAPPAPLPAAPTVGQSAAPKKLSGSGIPTRAKTAYTHAATRIAALTPGCHLPWTLLAAIGRVESDHGRAGGSTLIPSSGRANPPIYGARLDGTTPGTSVVRDTDHATLDADPLYDRAVGPMQFLPTTWRSLATDADHDGAANPQDIDDATLTAARYLCTPPTGTTTVPDLTTPTGQWNAAWRYNHSTSYANLVLALATTYATGRPTTVVNPPPGATTTQPTLTITITPTPTTSTLTGQSTTPVSTTSTSNPTTPTSGSSTTVTVTQTPTTTTPGNSSTVTVITVTVTASQTTPTATTQTTVAK